MDVPTLDAVGILTVLLNNNIHSYAEIYAELYSQKHHSSELYRCCQLKIQQMDSSKFAEFLSKCKEFDYGSSSFQRVLKDRNHAAMTRTFLEFIIRFE